MGWHGVRNGGKAAVNKDKNVGKGKRNAGITGGKGGVMGKK